MKTPTSSSRRIRTVAETASLLVAALALSYLESLIPLASLVPLPGFKPGFANIIIIIAYYRLSPYVAGSVQLGRIVISSLLFSGITTIFYSLSGAVLSFAALLIADRALKDKIGFIGLSVLCALFHNVGQLICAAFMMGSSSVLYYFPALGISSVICGCLTGIVLCVLPTGIYSGKVYKNA